MLQLSLMLASQRVHKWPHQLAACSCRRCVVAASAFAPAAACRLSAAWRQAARPPPASAFHLIASRPYFIDWFTWNFTRRGSWPKRAAPCLWSAQMSQSRVLEAHPQVVARGVLLRCSVTVVAADRDVGAGALQHHSQHTPRRLDDISLVLHVICRAAVTCTCSAAGCQYAERGGLLCMAVYG